MLLDKLNIILNSSDEFSPKYIISSFVKNTLYEISDNIFIKGNGSDKKLYILISSDSGLCGGFNSNPASYLNEKYGDRM